MDDLRSRAVWSVPTASLLILLAAANLSAAGDWSRFRGPNGSGVSTDAAPLPVHWSSTENLKWKIKLPGPGSSSPIVVGDKIFVTSWSGYGMERGDRSSDQKDLKRHLVCLNRKTGDIIWDKTVDAVLPEENYGGMFAEHGYATHSPVSDGERVYVFFGKTGALAFDMDGKQLWQTPLGTGSDRMGWGSACSPILYKNLLIVTASAENESMYALDTLTGKEVWRAEAEGFRSTWGTPALVDIDEKRTDIVISVPYEIWGFDPASGRLSWYCEALDTRSVSASVVTDGKVVYAMGDQGSGSIAVTAGGTNDVTKSHVVWKGRDNNRISTPVISKGRLYFVSNGVVTCVDTKTNERLFQGRLSSGAAVADAEGEPERRPPRGEGGPGPGGAGRGGGRGGRGGGQDYSSPVVGDGKLYFVTRGGECHVVKLSDQFEKLASNRVTDEPEDFSATPAISDGALFIRSSKHLYCIAEAKK